MEQSAYSDLLERLRARLEADPRVLGLVLLGSTADESYRDPFSDHDFWIVTEPGAQCDYLDTHAWLPDADKILFSARHGASYRGALYRNRHKVEYAVFDMEEATRGKIERFHIAFDRGGVAELARAVREQSHRERAEQLARPDTLENFCMLLWTARERSLRGESLSAHMYLLAAFGALLDLLVAQTPSAPQADRLDPRRRLERLWPETGRELNHILSLPQRQAEVALFDFARRVVRPVAPDLAWAEAETVGRWLEEDGEE